jgi:excisionase family DNA binding protein
MRIFMGTDLDGIDNWMAITQAAQRLGVHPTTLRRWADEGQLPVMLTPGGHRRFSDSDLERFTKERSRLRVIFGFEEMWAEAALSRARTEIVNHQEKRWLHTMNEADRERKRLLGRRMIDLLLQYVSLDRGGDEVVEEMKAIGREHALQTLKAGLPSRDALQAAMFFQDAVTDAAIHLPETGNIRLEANMRFLRRIDELLNAFQLSIAEVYDQAMRS